VFAEAVGQANLRSGPGIEYPAIGQIATGTRYRIRRATQPGPWLRLDVRAVAPQQAWVFADLVSVYGPVSSVHSSATSRRSTRSRRVRAPAHAGAAGLPPATLPPSQEQPPVAPPAASLS